MALVLNEEQRLLKDSAGDFLSADAPIDSFRQLRDAGNPQGYDKGLWQKIIEMGWPGIAIDEAYDGLGFGFQGLGVIFEQAGHRLLASPMFATMVLGASAIELAGNNEQKQAYLPRIASGEVTLAFALEEQVHHAPTAIETIATSTDQGFLITGKKTFVLDANNAHTFIVVARVDDQKDNFGLFMVDANVPGVNVVSTQMMDARDTANVTLNDVVVSREALLGGCPISQDVMDVILDRGRILLSAEMLGNCLEAFNRTMDYLKEREQFGVKIGSFQALKHRASQMFIGLEMAKSLVLKALTALDEHSDDVSLLASLTKAKLNALAKQVTDEATQMHGGMGVTDELDIGLIMKRVRVATQILGDSYFHQNRYAVLRGY